jgi:hypothetical protein
MIKQTDRQMGCTHEQADRLTMLTCRIPTCVKSAYGPTNNPDLQDSDGAGGCLGMANTRLGSRQSQWPLAVA